MSEGDPDNNTTEGLPVSPSLVPTIDSMEAPPRHALIDRRVLFICGLSVVLGAIAAVCAVVLLNLISFITHLCFYGTISTAKLTVPPHFGPWVILVPVAGGIIIGLMIRYGHQAVAGHGIPEAMEQVLTNQSRIPPRLTLLKPLGAAISIGTGGPYGAEGPIIATGGALGSLIGQMLSVTAMERKTLLAAGAAAGIAGIFGTPISGVLLAIELLLFEFRPRSFIPVALACAVAAALHGKIEGFEPMFGFSGDAVPVATVSALAVFTFLGGLVGVGSVVLTRTVHWIEQRFEHLPLPRMLHPAIGALAVGVICWWSPRIFGSGYFNLNDLLAGSSAQGMLLATAVSLLLLKFVAWTVSLGSGTAGGTLAPVFTIGGALGLVLATLLNHVSPVAVDVRMAALVGMVAIFAGASRAMLTSVAFAFELTLEPHALLPALCGCAAAYVVSSLLMKESIMSEAMSRRGVKVPEEYSADMLEQVRVAAVATPAVITLRAERSVEDTRQWMESGDPTAEHQGFPLIDEDGLLVGVITRRDVLNTEHPAGHTLSQLLRRPPIVVYDDCTLREAADHMVRHDVGRLPVVSRVDPRNLVGIVTRSDVLSAYRRRVEDQRREQPRMPLVRGHTGRA